MSDPHAVADKNVDDVKQLGNMCLNEKAGMQGLDIERINEIIREASKGSKFYQHKQKSQERIELKKQETRAALAKLTEQQKTAARLKVRTHNC